MRKNYEFERECCICGYEVEGIGHNPYPVIKRKGAVCCNWCDSTIVIPARFAEMRAIGRAEAEHK